MLSKFNSQIFFFFCFPTHLDFEINDVSILDSNVLYSVHGRTLVVLFLLIKNGFVMFSDFKTTRFWYLVINYTIILVFSTKIDFRWITLK